jgi:hypothetical protein
MRFFDPAGGQMGYNMPIEYASGSTVAGTWMSLRIGETTVYKFRVDGHPERVGRIRGFESSAGFSDVKRLVSALAVVPPEDIVVRRRS